MNEVLCQFCKMKCRPEDKFGFRCDYHGGVIVRYYFPDVPNQDWHTLILAYITDDVRYHAVFLYNNPNYTYKFRIDKVKKGYKGALQATEVFHLDFHPDITPENLPNKITKYIIFS